MTLERVKTDPSSWKLYDDDDGGGGGSYGSGGGGCDVNGSLGHSQNLHFAILPAICT